MIIMITRISTNPSSLLMAHVFFTNLIHLNVGLNAKKCHWLEEADVILKDVKSFFFSCTHQYCQLNSANEGILCPLWLLYNSLVRKNKYLLQSQIVWLSFGGFSLILSVYYRKSFHEKLINWKTIPFTSK